MRKRLKWSILLVCGMVLLIQSVAMAQKKYSFFTRWVEPESRAFMEEICAKFNKQHPGIKFEHSAVPSGEQSEALFTRFVAKDPPLVFESDTAFSRTFGKKGFIPDLRPYYEKYDWYSLIPASCIKFVTNPSTGEEIYAIPYYGGHYGCINYRKDVLREVGLPSPDPLKPMLWVDFLKYCEKIKPIMPPLTLGNRHLFPFQHLIGGVLSQCFSIEEARKLWTELEPKFTDWHAELGLRRIAELVNRGYFAPGLASLTVWEGVDLVFAKKAAISIGFPYPWIMQLREAGLVGKFDWGITPYPRIRADIPYLMQSGGGVQFTVASEKFYNKKEIDLGAELLNSIIGDKEVMQRMVPLLRGGVVIKGALTKKNIIHPAQVQYREWLELYPGAITEPNVDITMAVRDIGSGLAVGEITVHQCALELQKAKEKIYKK